MIGKLIDKYDTFEIVRDKIAAILLTEVADQRRLAADAGKDPNDWDLRIFTERSNVWEQFRDGTEEPATPIVNITYETSEMDGASGDTVHSQKYTATYHLDCYAMGVNQGTQQGDQDAALRIQAVVRLVRNILMAGTYTRLGLLGIVGDRRVQSMTVFRPDASDEMAQNIIGARIIFRVTFNEESPQVEAVPLEIIGVELHRAETGEILLELEYQYDGN